jgi:hypothetical protein
MTAAELLAEARAVGVRLRLAPNGSTKVAGSPSPELLARLRAAKRELTELLAGNRCRRCAEPLAWPEPVGVVYGDGQASCWRCYGRTDG